MSPGHSNSRFPPILPEEGIFSIKVRIRKKERMKLSPYLVIWNVDVLVLPLLGFILREKSRSVVVTEQIMPIAPYFENPKLFLSGKNTLIATFDCSIHLTSFTEKAHPSRSKIFQSAGTESSFFTSSLWTSSQGCCWTAWPPVRAFEGNLDNFRWK